MLYLAYLQLSAQTEHQNVSYIFLWLIIYDKCSTIIKQNLDVHPPTLETLENIMKLSPMIVQALWDKNKKFSLLQLPYITESHLKHFVTKKVIFFLNISILKKTTLR